MEYIKTEALQRRLTVALPSGWKQKKKDDDSGAPRAETTPRTERASGEIV